MRYLFLHSEGSAELEDQAGAAIEGSLSSWVEETIDAGVNLGGSRLRPASEARTVRVRSGEVLVTDGPFAETKEQVGGYDLIECVDLDAALEVAARHPTVRSGTIEVRPLRGQ